MTKTASDRAIGTAAMLTGGIDVGSSAVKVALVEDRGADGATLVAGRFERTRRREPGPVAEGIVDEMLAAAGRTRADLGYLATTGEGEVVASRTGHFYGMTTHARGGLFLCPEARSVIDIGALHARAVMMDERAKVLGYRMTNQCASGSGQFLENICRFLGVALEEIGPLSLQADAPEKSSSICAVLAETDVINLVSRGIATPNILKGIHQSMAGRYVRLLQSAGATGVSLVTGGLSADVGLVAAMREAVVESKMDLEIRVHEHSALAGAIGAALWGAFRARRLAATGASA